MDTERVLLRNNQIKSKRGLYLLEHSAIVRNHAVGKNSFFSVTNSPLNNTGNSQPYWQRGDFKQ